MNSTNIWQADNMECSNSIHRKVICSKKVIVVCVGVMLNDIRAIMPN